MKEMNKLCGREQGGRGVGDPSERVIRDVFLEDSDIQTLIKWDNVFVKGKSEHSAHKCSPSFSFTHFNNKKKVNLNKVWTRYKIYQYWSTNHDKLTTLI